MNKQDIQSSVYAQKVDLLLRLLPLVMEEMVFAVHGGTAINLFLRNLPRYSVDIDLTYIPLADRKRSIDDINSPPTIPRFVWLTSILTCLPRYSHSNLQVS